MKKIIQLTTAIFVTSPLLGCDTYNKEEFKKSAQNMYDRVQTNLKIKGNFCYYLGSVKFPYTDIPPSNEDSQWEGWNKEDLANTLPLFAEIGLLTRQPVDGKERLYHYDLTELGQEYLYSSYKKSTSGRTYYDNSFCYGPIKVIKVTDVSEKTYERGLSGYNETQITVKINYQVVNTPEWVINNQDKLKALYGLYSVHLPDVTYPETLLYIKGKDGQLYNKSSLYLLMKPSGKLLTDKE
ncbi:hypothetical protein B6D12_05865 [Gilliamella apicola]|uniref:hypothetical protein n=1 Tax=Gilliamella apicola TaxID=1196095 RepID=UPI000A332B63|nr:hypothetical protein [Gilliamella apicola]OTP89259.1 hypothetical protein B5S41_07155 [Gilliamella apicola]OTP96143.1 hypothetical protein B6D13_01295 [Gilliamella apicola]OTQ01994.1 hypothetical protein B6D07_07450 [Gilliamella apicola]OTQ05851.1 hypothetical protein B6D12_05865 [Gilliamella apicola]OTQ26609.1 hypothetical protein B6D02_10770 [Gilliamella apicola]